MESKILTHSDSRKTTHTILQESEPLVSGCVSRFLYCVFTVCLDTASPQMTDFDVIMKLKKISSELLYFCSIRKIEMNHMDKIKIACVQMDKKSYPIEEANRNRG